jgi:hypothetical protein
MLAHQIIPTVGLKQCQSCGAKLLDRDKFCRRCGVEASDPSTVVSRRADSSDLKAGEVGGTGTLRRSYSGSLVGIVTQELSERTSSLHANRWAMHLVSALVALPLWLMIVLLSPLDAYVAAKAIARQV